MESLFNNPWFWVGLLLSGIFSAALAIWRRQNRQHRWYEMQLPVIVGIGVSGVLICMAYIIGLLQTAALFAAFSIAGIIQWYECISWQGIQDREQARKEAHIDTPEKMA